MIKRIYTLIFISLIAVGCNKSEIDSLNIGGDDSGKITFTTTADWTKGAVVNDISDVANLALYNYYVEGKWASVTSIDDLGNFLSSDIYTPATLVYSDSDSGIGAFAFEDGTYYWPVEEDKYLNFFAYYPGSELSYTVSNEGKPKFSYEMSMFAEDNDDLVFDTRCDMNSEVDGGNVAFDLQHLLSNIKLKAQLSGVNSDAVYGEVFTINGITFSGLYTSATLGITYNEDGTRSFSWSVDTDEAKTSELTATQGVTLKDVETYSLTTESMTDVMLNDDISIFALPQEITSRTTRPTVELRIRRSYYNEAPMVSNIDGDGYLIEADAYNEAGESALDILTALEDEPLSEKSEIIYETATLELTVPSGQTAWIMSQGIQYTFAFDIGNLSENDTPLTITSDVLSWTDTEIEADIHSNLYMYSSQSNITAVTDGDDTYGEFMICTNYDYNLRVPHHRMELDTAITSSRGFMFYSNDFNIEEYDNDNNVGTYITTSDNYEDKTFKKYVPTLLSIDSDGVEYKLYYATEDNISEYDETSPIYEYPGGYDGTNHIEISGVTKDNIKYGSNKYAYILDGGYYRLLYIDPQNTSDGKGALTAFNYETNEDTGYHEIELTNFADEDNKTVNFKIEITDTYSFDFSVKKSTRDDEDLYISTAVSSSESSYESGTSYGVNKKADDPVYILCLSVNTEHLGQMGGKFDDIIGVEIVTNGGGIASQLFPVTLTGATTTSELE